MKHDLVYKDGPKKHMLLEETINNSGINDGASNCQVIIVGAKKNLEKVFHRKKNPCRK